MKYEKITQAVDAYLNYEYDENEPMQGDILALEMDELFQIENAGDSDFLIKEFASIVHGLGHPDDLIAKLYLEAKDINPELLELKLDWYFENKKE